jgi:Ca2+-transporting ATPase
VIEAIHTSVKGRARFRVEGLLRSESLKSYLELRLSEKREITSVRASTLTASVLVYFNSDRDPRKIASFIESALVDYREQVQRLGSPGVPAPGKASPRGNNGLLARLRKTMLPLDGQRAKKRPWHLMEAESALAALGASRVSGLPSEVAAANLRKYGLNILPESVSRSRLDIFFGQFRSLPVVLLLAAAGLSVLTGGLADSLVIMAVVALNAAIGYKTESQAEETISSLKRLVRPSAWVLRSGALQEVPAEQVALGDILVLRPGTYVAADARLIEASHLSVDESVLTGESLPVVKTSRPLAGPDISLPDRVNMVYTGTLITGGQGLAVAVATAKFTEVGRLQILVGEAAPPETPMERRLRKIGNQLVAVSSGLCGVVFGIGLLRGYGPLQMLKTSVALAVAAVPEGLPTVATTTLALGVQSMRRHHVLVRQLDAVATLGAVQTLCLDKTGTITLNRMSVVRIHTGMRSVFVSEGEFSNAGGRLNPFTSDDLLRLIHVSVLCSETEVEQSEGKYVLRGSATENAIVHMAIEAGVDIGELERKYPLLKIAHRSESRNFMSTLRWYPEGQRLVALKGSPPEVLAMCSWLVREGRRVPLTDEDRFDIESANERMAADALRVLGVAYSVQGAEADLEGTQDGFIWLGLLGMADPVRKGVRELMAGFHRAGIDTVMITGDQSPTAYAIGKELNLSDGAPLEILDSTHLARVDPELMRGLSQAVHVFARVSPAHKLQIVQALQGAGKVVAMTGDGINDGPALKAADIGIAMGRSGTDVARDVADVVLEEDNLETMLVAVSDSRTIYNNIRKSVHFLLATNLSEIMVMFSALAMGIGSPLSAMQLLWINIMSDVWPGLALAFEPPEPDVLSRPPRDPAEPIVRASDLKRVGVEAATISAATLGAYGYGAARYGIGPKAGTMAFQSLTTAQLLHALSCRSEKISIFDKDGLPPNRYLSVALGCSLILQMLSMLVPGLRKLLGLTPLNRFDGMVVGGSALLPLIVNEKTKKMM